MEFAAYGLGLLGVACCLLLWWLLWNSPLRRYVRLLLPGLAAFWLLLVWETHNRGILAAQQPAVLKRPVEMPANGYVSSDECQACHPGKYHSWHQTYHRTMTQLPGPDSVVGDFSGQSFEFESVRFRPYEDAGKYFVSVTDLREPAARQQTTTHEVVLLTGSHNYQVYWYETDRPRELGQVPIVYFVQDQRWLPRQAGFIQPHKEILSDKERGRWNRQCILCHAVNGREERDPDRKLMPVDSRVSEFGIACEACHGPAAEHVAQYRNPLRRYLAHFGWDDGPRMVSPEQLGAERVVHLCGQCHSVQNVRDDWWKKGSAFRPGDLLEPDRELIWGDPDRWTPGSWRVLQAYYWRDGVVRVRGREFHDVLRSPCFESGDFSCLTCHSLHKESGDERSDADWANGLLKPAAASGAVCLDCHHELQSQAGRAAHTRHAAGTAGDACMNCHMPNTTIGFLRGMRNHRITVPDVWQSLSTGRPLACNQCHLDQTLAWSSRHLHDWYGHEMPELPPVHREVAASLVWTWAGDAGQRALGAWNFRWPPARQASGADWTTPHLLELLRDDYPGVRQVALRSLEENRVLQKEAVEVFAPADERERQIAEKTAALALVPAHAIELESRQRLLLGADGRLDRDAVGTLLRMRDPAPMLLRE